MDQISSWRQLYELFKFRKNFQKFPGNFWKFRKRSKTPVFFLNQDYLTPFWCKKSKCTIFRQFIKCTCCFRVEFLNLLFWVKSYDIFNMILEFFLIFLKKTRKKWLNFLKVKLTRWQLLTENSKFRILKSKNYLHFMNYLKIVSFDFFHHKGVR
jgi:hypothetical protein